MDIINKLAGKLAGVEAIKAKLTPTFLQMATKEDLKKEIDEVDNLVKTHHEIYDATQWTSKPAVEIIG